MRLGSVSDIAEFTGKDRRTVTARLATLEPTKQKGKALLYRTDRACELIFVFGSELEQEAKAAKSRQLIDEAESARMDLEVRRERLIEKNAVTEGLADLLTKYAQTIRQSKLSEPEKKQLLDEVRAVKSKWE